LNEDNAVDKSEDWWHQIEAQHKLLKTDLKNLTGSIDVIKSKEYFIRNKDSNPDEVKKEIEHNRMLLPET